MQLLPAPAVPLSGGDEGETLRAGLREPGCGLERAVRLADVLCVGEDLQPDDVLEAAHAEDAVQIPACAGHE